MTSTSIDLRERTGLDMSQEDLRPISRQEFRALLWMVSTAFVFYVVVMALFVR